MVKEDAHCKVLCRMHFGDKKLVFILINLFLIYVFTLQFGYLFLTVLLTDIHIKYIVVNLYTRLCYLLYMFVQQNRYPKLVFFVLHV